MCSAVHNCSVQFEKLACCKNREWVRYRGAKTEREVMMLYSRGSLKRQYLFIGFWSCRTEGQEEKSNTKETEKDLKHMHFQQALNCNNSDLISGSCSYDSGQFSDGSSSANSSHEMSTFLAVSREILRQYTLSNNVSTCCVTFHDLFS